MGVGLSFNHGGDHSTMAPLKADSEDFPGRFREIISDPLNLLIERVPEAGTVAGAEVCLHNGNWVPLAGEGGYYGDFSKILVLNRGVHEPLEEYVFQEILKRLPVEPTMVELGAYWAHYSMWLQKARPQSKVFLVEPDRTALNAGVTISGATDSKANSSAQLSPMAPSKSMNSWNGSRFGMSTSCMPTSKGSRCKCSKAQLTRLQWRSLVISSSPPILKSFMPR